MSDKSSWDASQQKKNLTGVHHKTNLWLFTMSAFVLSLTIMLHLVPLFINCCIRSIDTSNAENFAIWSFSQPMIIPSISLNENVLLQISVYHLLCTEYLRQRNKAFPLHSTRRNFFLHWSQSWNLSIKGSNIRFPPRATGLGNGRDVGPSREVVWGAYSWFRSEELEKEP